MTGAPGLLYLEADDEVTTVVRRLRSATEPRIVVVAPGRSRATSSAVALRLLARVAAAEDREIAIVGDPLTRSLAAEAGIIAYATVDDARNARASQPPVPASRRAAIHVVRGIETDDAAPTLAAAPVPDPDPAWAETRPMRAAPATVPASEAGPARRPSGALRLPRVTPVTIVAGALAVLVLGGGVAGAVLLPSARVMLIPRTVEIGPRTYTIQLEGADRLTGTVEETATVVPTGSYPILEPAIGTVTFFNWNVAGVQVPAGTLVAAGEQAFGTVETVVVPSGRLTPDGRILAGEADVGVVASAPGPAANVPAEAIDTVLSQGTAARLRGFPNNPERLVLNRQPTHGGLDDTGVEFTQADFDAAAAALREALLEELESQIDAGDRITLFTGDAAEPTFDGLDGLVGTRDTPEAVVRGSLAYDRWLVEPELLDAAAAERLAEDDSAVPDGFTLSEAAVSAPPETTVSADGILVTVEVTGRATASIDHAAIAERIRGLDAAAARAELSEMGRVEIELWPEWIGSVPQLDWRIEVVVEEPEPQNGAAQAATDP